jgi:hypothetical protein
MMAVASSVHSFRRGWALPTAESDLLIGAILTRDALR